MIVFSDLDGTLLDEAYDYEPARPGLEALRVRRVPLVLCSSKTRAEMQPLVDAIAPGQPFVAENGGAIVVPVRDLPPPAGALERDGTWTVPLGTPTARLDGIVREIAAELALPLRGWSAMSLDEIVEATGLSQDEATRARAREWSEPFGPLNDTTRARSDDIEAAARARGLVVTRGGRFFHLSGATNKGKAVRALIAYLQWVERRVRHSVGLGDAPNDLELLEAVDEPVIVPRPVADPILRRALPRARVAPWPGPRGWNAAMNDILGRS